MLQVSSEDIAGLVDRLAKMVALARRAEDLVRSIPDVDTSRYLSWKSSVETSFSAISLVGELTGFVEPLKLADSRALERLGFCADLLSREGRDKVLEQSELEQIRTEIENLKDEVQSSTVEAELKLFMLHQLGTLLDGIDEYSLFGLDSIGRATNQTVGQMFLEVEARQRLSATNFADKFWIIFQRLAQVVSVASGGLQIVATVMKILPPPNQ